MTSGLLGPIAILLLVMMAATAVHEAGHWVAARLKGARVLRVQVGRGPGLWRAQRGETEYVLAVLPFGGRIDFEGLKGGTAAAVVAVSGAVANVLAALVLLLAGALVFGVAQMPYAGGLEGEGMGGAVRYAVDGVGSWMWAIPRLIANQLGAGVAPGPSLAVLPELVREGSAAAAIHFAAAVSTLWGVLNLIPVPGLRTDGWQFIRAFLPGDEGPGGEG